VTHTRPPAFAGTFYAAKREEVRAQVEGCFTHRLGPGAIPAAVDHGPRRLIGLIAPHAGYAYSGPIAAHAYAALAADGRPEVVILIGPNHQGFGPTVSISQADHWQTPLGSVRVDRTMADAIGASLPEPSGAEEAHQAEHSLEVQLPFLQYLYGSEVPIVPIVMADQSSDVAQDLGLAIANAVEGRDAVIIASTDLAHYEAQRVAVQLDQLALEAMRQMEPEQLLQVARQHVTMCGPGAVAALLVASLIRGLRQVTLLRHATSGDVSGDLRHVVGYAALALTR
jgi:MEMO1 family protein